MNAVVPFEFEGKKLSVLTDPNGEPWFVAKEVADILGYSDAFEMTKRLDVDEKRNRQIAGLGPQTGGRGVSTINESGLYSSILGSQKTESKAFKKWVTSEVLPSIRKTGSYTATKSAPIKIAAEAAKAFQPLFRVACLMGCDKNAAAIAANQAVMGMTQVNLMQQLGHTHLEAANQDALYVTPTALGLRMGQGTSARAMNQLLAGAGLQVKQLDGTWEMTSAGQRYGRIFDTGKRHASGVPVPQIKWATTVLAVIEEQKDAA